MVKTTNQAGCSSIPMNWHPENPARIVKGVCWKLSMFGCIFAQHTGFKVMFSMWLDPVQFLYVSTTFESAWWLFPDNSEFSDCQCCFFRRPSILGLWSNFLTKESVVLWPRWINSSYITYLVGGLEHDLMSSSQLRNSIIFQRGRYTTNQYIYRDKYKYIYISG